MKLHRSLLPSLLATLAATSLSPRAAERLWDGGDVTANLSAPANWDGNTALNLATDDLNFPSGVSAANKSVTNNYADLTAFRTFHFQESGYSVYSGNRMWLSDGITGNFASGSVSLDVELLLNKHQTWFADGGGDINFLSGSQISAGSFNLTLQARHENSVLSLGGVLLGDGVIRVQDEGMVRFTSQNSFSGDVFIENGGTLEISDENALGNVGVLTIADGTFSLNKAASMSVSEQIVTSSTLSNRSYIESRGLGHGLYGTLDLGGSAATVFDVQGTSLVLGSVIKSSVFNAGILKTGPGRLLITGSAVNSASLGSFDVLEGEAWLHRTNGPAISDAYYVRLGRGEGSPPDSAIIRLGASNQLPENNSLTITDGGLLDLNGFSDEIGILNFNGPGRIDTGGGTLRMNTLQAYDATDAGLTALISGNVVLTETYAQWQINGDDQSIKIKLDGSLTCPPGGSLAKTSAGELEITGPVTASRFRALGGRTTLSSNSPNANLEVDGGNFWDVVVNATGTLGDIRLMDGKLSLAGLAAHGDLICKDFTVDAAGAVELTFTNFLPNMHDVIHVHGAVALQGSLISGFLAPLPPAGHEITIIDNDGTDPVTGAFTNAPEGSVVASQFIISYKGGDGNDVTVTRFVPPTGTTRTWDGGGTDNNWSTDNNWNPNGKPEEGDNLVFPVTAARKSSVNDYPAGTTFNRITVQGTAYIFNGGSITLNDKLEYTHTAASCACGLPVKLAKHGKISVAGTSSLLVSGALSTNNKTLTLEHTGDGSAGEMTVSAIISGAGDVVKSGPGVVAFSANANTYTGITTVTGGVLALTPGASLGTIGSTAGTSVENGAVLELRNTLGDVTCFDEIQLGGTIRDTGGTFPARFGSAACLTDLAAFEANGNTLASTGVLSGAGNARKTGAGRFTMEGTAGNNWTGTFTIAAGEVVLAKSGNALPPATVVGDGTDTTASRLTLAAAGQIPDTATVKLHGKLAVFHAAAFAERFATLTFAGGTATGSLPGLLTLTKVETLASANSAVLSAPLSPVAGSPLNITAAAGAAAPDLELSGPVYGLLFEKNGSGSVNFTTAIPAAGLDAVKIKSGQALFMADCRYTNIELAGGTLGGTGTVGTVSVSSNGTVAPGTGPNPNAPGRLSALASTWNSTTSLRLELNGLAAGTEYDQFTALAPLALGGGPLVLSSTITPAPDTQFVIVKNDSGQPVSGTFKNLPEGGCINISGEKVFRITYQGGDGDDVVLTAVPAEKPQIVTHTMQPGQGDDYKDYWKTDITAKGTPGLTYQLQYSTDLSTWSSGGSSAASLDTGALSFEFYTEKSFPRCYYRVRLP